MSPFPFDGLLRTVKESSPTRSTGGLTSLKFRSKAGIGLLGG